jgi:hypothetical protein
MDNKEAQESKDIDIQEIDLEYYIFVHNLELAILHCGHAMNLFPEDFPEGIRRGLDFCRKRLISLNSEVMKLSAEGLPNII